MADIFVSYRQEQRPQVQRVAKALEALGLSVFYDARIHSGANFDQILNRELNEARAVLVCWTADATDSVWVRAEAAHGLDRNVLVAAKLEPVRLPAPFNVVQTEDLSDWNEGYDHDGFLRVLQRVGALTGQPNLADLAKARSQEAAWAERDSAARATFAARVRLAEEQFTVLHNQLPTEFVHSLEEHQAAFEQWLLDRRVLDAGEMPDPTAAALFDVPVLRQENAALRRERDALASTFGRVSPAKAGRALKANRQPRDWLNVMGVAVYASQHCYLLGAHGQRCIEDNPIDTLKTRRVCQ